jgi:hypothetical protein
MVPSAAACADFSTPGPPFLCPEVAWADIP